LEPRCYLVWMLRYQYFRFRPGIAAAIFKNRFPVSSGSISNSAVELLDHENMGVPFVISFLSHLEAEIRVFPDERRPSWIFRLPVTSDNVPNCVIESLDHEIMGVAFVISYLSHLEFEILVSSFLRCTPSNTGGGYLTP